MESAIIDYIEGWYDKDPDRMGQGLHQFLAKRTLDSGAANGIRHIGYEELLTIVKEYGGTRGSERIIDIEILDVTNNIASARVISNSFHDYLHLVQQDGEWQILNVLWELGSFQQKNLNEEQVSALERPVFDYIEGWYDRDEKRMEHGLHPALAKRSLNPQSEGGIHHYSRESLLIDLQKYGGQNGTERIIEIEILDLGKDIASVKVTSNSYVDYLHLCQQDNEWRILNVLWSFKP